MMSALTSMQMNRLQPGMRVLVLGLGKTGLSCARHLAAHGVELGVMDTRAEPPGLAQLREELPGAAVFLGGLDAAVLGRADLIVASPGLALATPEIRRATDRGIPVVGDIELFAWGANAPIAAITGSNGKSTVTTLLGAMARDAGRQVAVGGNLGTPALDLLDQQANLYILELSSFQLETTSSLRPAVATVLNISPDHMDRYGDLSEYVRAKARIFAGAGAGVYNLDDPEVMALCCVAVSRGFTLGVPANDEQYGLRALGNGDDWLCRGAQPLLPVAELKIAGWHNVANALAALAMGELLGFQLEQMQRTLRVFGGLPHRTQYVATVSGVDFYNDSKGTNPGASIAALEGLQRGEGRTTVLIAGGEGKNADFTELGRVIGRCARGLVLIGRDGDLIARTVAADLPVRHAADLDEAVRLALELAEPGDRVLLSPACASFDMFRNYEHRGEEFVAAVRRLSA